jgi:hypothetical protein
MPGAPLFAALLLGAGELASSALSPQRALAEIRPAAPRSAPGEALAVIDQCVARLDAEVDVGFRRIGLRCPELPAALERGGFERWLPRDWRAPDNELSAGGLEELRELLASELTMQPVRRPPSVQHLRRVLVELGAPARRGAVRRQIERWLRRLDGLREPSRPAGSLPMLGRVDLAPLVTKLLALAALAGLLVLAAVILLNELRAAGVLRAPSRSRNRGIAAPVASAGAVAELQGVSAAERPRMLLALILERLSRARGLTGLRSLTAQELMRAGLFDDAESARQLVQLALTAERVRYARTAASADDLAAAARGGGALLEKLAA